MSSPHLCTTFVMIHVVRLKGPLILILDIRVILHTAKPFILKPH
jgi:hypothetical protein